jgi:hypothetical protein
MFLSRHHREFFPLLVVFALCLAVDLDLSAETITSTSGDIAVQVEANGSYQVSAHIPHWQLSGNLPSATQNLVVGQDKDGVGPYHQLSFRFTDDQRPMTGFIRLYDRKELVLFSQTIDQASEQPPAPFPNFSSFPTDLFHYSFRDAAFAPPSFSLEKNAGPWLLFDDQYHALILSPASHFPCACMAGDGKKQLASGFNGKLRNVPDGFTQQSVLVLTQGINHAWDLWGQAIIDWEGKKRPANDSDPLLKYLGYWTDNGGAYWYNYDQSKGYQGTLLALMDSYRQKQIPFRYLQLDSWWYYKSLTGYNGKQGKTKNSKLPDGDWNRYGGTMEYKAHPFIFPEGMEAFHEKVGLPLVTHNRWIDPTSPYQHRYKFAGIAGIDPAFWDEIATYLQTSGVICYEQDWLTDIFKSCPELSSTVDKGEAFLDTMAEGCQTHGLLLQYCSANPECFLQGSKYGNLTQIRVSDDHFVGSHYHDFFYVSKFAYSLGMWPFADVFQSSNTSSTLFSTLSAGPVGPGDAIDAENKDNLLRVVRADGVIVKPDVPVVPMDRTYLAEAQKLNLPLLATTYTDHEGVKTIYLTAYKTTKKASDSVSVSAAELGCKGPFYLFNYFSGTGAKMDKGAICPIALQGKDYGYFIAAPIGDSGVALLGDADRFVGTGKNRIAAIRDDGKQLSVEVILAEKESTINLRGYAATSPMVSVIDGTADPVSYNATTGLFSVAVHPDAQAFPQTLAGEPTRKITVVMELTNGAAPNN